MAGKSQCPSRPKAPGGTSLACAAAQPCRWPGQLVLNQDTPRGGPNGPSNVPPLTERKKKAKKKHLCSHDALIHSHSRQYIYLCGEVSGTPPHVDCSQTPLEGPPFFSLLFEHACWATDCEQQVSWEPQISAQPSCERQHTIERLLVSGRPWSSRPPSGCREAPAGGRFQLPAAASLELLYLDRKHSAVINPRPSVRAEVPRLRARALAAPPPRCPVPLPPAHHWCWTSLAQPMLARQQACCYLG
jgi:hypothetical protein